MSTVEVIRCSSRQVMPHSCVSHCASTRLGYGFNPGSALLLPNAESTSAVAARSAACTTLSAAFGGLSGLFVHLLTNYVEHNEIVFSLESTMNGALAGLVGITGAKLIVQMWSIPLTRSCCMYSSLHFYCFLSCGGNSGTLGCSLYWYNLR